MASDTAEPVVMQGDNERSRVTVAGRRTDDGEQCTVVAVCETGGTWAMYPHGWGRFGVRLPRAEAVKVARAILKDAGLEVTGEYVREAGHTG